MVETQGLSTKEPCWKFLRLAPIQPFLGDFEPKLFESPQPLQKLPYPLSIDALDM